MDLLIYGRMNLDSKKAVIGLCEVKIKWMESKLSVN